MTKNFNKITLDKSLYMWYNRSDALLYAAARPCQSFNERGNIVKKLTMPKRPNCLVKYLTMSQPLVSTAPIDYPPRAEPASQAQHDDRRTQHTRRIDTYTHSTHNDAQHTAHTMMHSIERHRHTHIHREKSTVYISKEIPTDREAHK